MVCGWTWTDLFGSQSILILSSSEQSNKISSIITAGKIFLQPSESQFPEKDSLSPEIRIFRRLKICFIHYQISITQTGNIVAVLDSETELRASSVLRD